MNPELSIIIPCYNYAHFLRETLNSILRQDYQNYELLLIDDGSTDSSWEIMEEYAQNFPQVKPLKHEKNRGIFESNQTGWENAKGKYLHFFGADDLYLPNCLSQVMAYFHQNPHLGLICTDLEYFYDQTGEKKIKKLLQDVRMPECFLLLKWCRSFEPLTFPFQGRPVL